MPAVKIDGEWYHECAAILLILAERDPERQFVPSPDTRDWRECVQWLFYLSNTLQPTFRRWFYCHEAAGEEHSEVVANQARAEIEGIFTMIDRHLDGRAFLAGPRMTVADIMLTMLLRWSRNMPKPATKWPSLKRMADLMRRRPALQAVHAKESLTDWIND